MIIKTYEIRISNLESELRTIKERATVNIPTTMVLSRCGGFGYNYTTFAFNDRGELIRKSYPEKNTQKLRLWYKTIRVWDGLQVGDNCWEN